MNPAEFKAYAIEGATIVFVDTRHINIEDLADAKPGAISEDV